VSVVNTGDELAPALALAFSYDREILIEKYIRGMEVQVGILGERALGAIEIVPKDVFYSFKAKYEHGMSDHFFPARVPEAVYHRTLDAGLGGPSRPGLQRLQQSGFILDAAGEPSLLEVNTLPGMTATSLLPDIARGVGMQFPIWLRRS